MGKTKIIFSILISMLLCNMYRIEIYAANQTILNSTKVRESLAKRINADGSFNATVLTDIGAVSTTAIQDIAHGGTGGTTSTTARTNLGLGTNNSVIFESGTYTNRLQIGTTTVPAANTLQVGSITASTLRGINLNYDTNSDNIIDVSAIANVLATNVLTSTSSVSINAASGYDITLGVGGTGSVKIAYATGSTNLSINALYIPQIITTGSISVTGTTYGTISTFRIPPGAMGANGGFRAEALLGRDNTSHDTGFRYIVGDSSGTLTTGNQSLSGTGIALRHCYVFNNVGSVSTNVSNFAQDAFSLSSVAMQNTTLNTTATITVYLEANNTATATGTSYCAKNTIIYWYAP